MRIIHKAGFALNQNVDIACNSANNFLLHDSSGAGILREHSGKLTTKQKQKYQKLLDKLNPKIKNLYERIAQQHSWQPHYANLRAIQLLLQQSNQQFKKGAAIYDNNWTQKKHHKKVIHIICVAYHVTLTSRKRKPATLYSIKSATKKALHIAQQKGAKSFAINVPCARKGYGITPNQSYRAVVQTLQKNGDFLDKAVICFDNKQTQEFMNKIR